MRRLLGLAVGVAVAAAIASAVWPRSEWPAGGMAGANVLLITIDTLRADRLTDRDMPGLSAWARQAHVFRTTYAHAPMTLPSHASILTGLLPPAHGVHGNGAFRLGDAHTTLAERLRAAGYRTGAFVGAFVLDPRFGTAQGFDHYDDVDDSRAFAADFAFAERRAPAVLAAAETWLHDLPAAGRWFAWVHLFDPHAPYDAPEQSGTDPYGNEVRFVDRAVSGFLSRLDQAGGLAHTMVVVTADHGESLGSHGETSHGLFAYDATMRVPLVVSGTGLGAGEHTTPVAHIDIVPTILDTLGLPGDVALPGRSLRLPAEAARPLYLEAYDGWLTAGAAPLTAIVAAGLKYIDLPDPELYDLAADPDEERNLLPAEAGRARPLATALRAIGAGHGVTSAGAVPPDRETEARLRSLGYASGASRTMPATFSATDDPKRIRSLYERFLAVLGAGAPDVDALGALVAVRPSFQAARLAAASVLIEGGRAGDAVALLEPAAGNADASLAIRERLGVAYLAAGRPDRAVALLGGLVGDPGASAEAWSALGVGRAQLGRITESMAALDQAVLLAPSSARIRFNRALTRLTAGDRAGARRDADDAAAAQASFVDAWRLRATLDHEAGDRAAAVAAWQHVLTLDPADLDTRFNLAVTLKDLGRIDDARAMASRFIELAPRPAANREIAILAPLLDRR
jgi:arylsulfatase A-like enzyme/Flp pilus assembly protein TadD